MSTQETSKPARFSSVAGFLLPQVDSSHIITCRQLDGIFDGRSTQSPKFNEKIPSNMGWNGTYRRIQVGKSPAQQHANPRSGVSLRRNRLPRTYCWRLRLRFTLQAPPCARYFFLLDKHYRKVGSTWKFRRRNSSLHSSRSYPCNTLSCHFLKRLAWGLRLVRIRL